MQSDKKKLLTGLRNRHHFQLEMRAFVGYYAGFAFFWNTKSGAKPSVLLKAIVRLCAEGRISLEKQTKSLSWCLEHSWTRFFFGMQ